MDKQMTFDEWWKVNELKYDYVFPASRDAFKAGQKSRQAEINALKKQLIKAGFTDRGGQLLVPPRGKPPCFDMLDAKQAELDEKDKRIETALDLMIDGHYELAEQALRGES